MTRKLIFAALLVAAAALLYATDMTVTTTRPQGDDDLFLLQVRRTEALANIDELARTNGVKVSLVGGAGTNVSATIVNASVPVNDSGASNQLVTAVSTLQTGVKLTNVTATLGTIVKTVAATATPEQLSGTGTIMRSVTFLGYKAARTANTGTVWIQVASGDGGAAVPLTTGQMITFVAPPERHYLATQFYIDVDSNGDGVVAVYEQ